MTKKIFTFFYLAVILSGPTLAKATSFECSAKCNYRMNPDYSFEEKARFPIAAAAANSQPSAYGVVQSSIDRALQFMMKISERHEGEGSYCHHHGHEEVLVDDQYVTLGVDIDGQMDVSTLVCVPRPNP